MLKNIVLTALVLAGVVVAAGCGSCHSCKAAPCSTCATPCTNCDK